jgi:coenzyme F420-0:L-glutamate ligase/coenzyme F420-1:gamma-L-glutamate ligase
MVKRVDVLGLEGIPLVKAGDDLAVLIVEAAESNGVEIEDADIIVVAQKVVSKAEGRVIKLDLVEPSKKALEIAGKTGKDPRIVELILRESKRFLKVSEQILIVEDDRDLVNINAGIDKSNVKGLNHYALLPVDPDQSARNLRSRIKELIGRDVGVVISDSYSRAFRRGQVNFAIGLAGVEPFIDYRGTPDLFGYVLQVKFSAVVDELAGAGELVMGQGDEGIPVALIKGLRQFNSTAKSSSKDLLITEDEDLFKDVW